MLLNKDGTIQLKTGKSTKELTLKELGDAAKAWQSEQPEDSAMLLVADKELSYQKVMDSMAAIQAAGVKRVALQVAGGASK